MLTKKMYQAKDLASLHRYKLLVQGTSVLVFGFGFIFLLLFFAPWKVGISEAQQEFYRGQGIWLITGIIFLSCSTYFIVVIRKWVQHVAWVYKHAKPESMILCIEEESDSDSTAYYAVIRDHDKTPAGHHTWKVAVYSPSWDTGPLMHKAVTAEVYLDPDTKVPVIIKTAYGFLWKMAGKASAVKVMS